jgi:hypothetical protein
VPALRGKLDKVEAAKRSMPGVSDATLLRYLVASKGDVVDASNDFLRDGR